MDKMYEMFWATKWVTENAKSLEDMAEMLESSVKDLRAMVATGKIRMDEPVDNGYAMFFTDDLATAEEFGFKEVEIDEEEFEAAEFEGGDIGG